MTPFEYFILVMATWHAIEVWHHGSIFANARASLQADGGLKAELATCMFCLSTHVGFWFALWMMMTSAGIWQIPVYALAVTRGANLANDFFHKWTKVHNEPISDNEE